MPKILEFFLRNPVLAVVVVVWLVGIVSNVAKSLKKARERADAAGGRNRRDSAPIETGGRMPEPRSPSTSMPAKTAAEIAREMRRILGVEPREPAAGSRAPVEAAEAAETPSAPPPLPARRTRSVVEPERPPAPVLPTTASRRLQIHVDPHVGEGIQRRAGVASGRVGEHAGNELGSLGGRVRHEGGRRSAGSRYALDELKRAIVINEILGPPLALRPHERG